MGAMLHEMAAGAPPFSAESLGGLLHEIIHTTPPPPSRLNPAVPPLLDLIVAKAMQKDPGARYQDARELAHDLQACRAQLPGAPPLPAASPAPTGDTAPYAATVRADAPARTVPIAAATALLPSLQFDSAAALQGLLAPRADPAAAGQGQARLARLAWPLAYAAALAAAIAIALA
jgi:serine/threonine-protein kinase